MGKRWRTEIAKIADPAARLVTYSKRRKGLFKKASGLCHLCGARAAIIVFSPAGEPCSFGDPSAEEVISEYVGGDGDVVPPMGLTELEDWIEKEWNFCATEEDLESLIVKYESVREVAFKSMEDLGKKSSVMIGAGGDTGAGLGCNSENLSDQEINLVFESFEAGCPALFEDCLCDGDGDAFSTWREKSIAGGGSWAVDSIPTCFHLEDCGFNPDNFLDLSADCVGVGDGDGDKFSTLPGNSATGVGSLGEFTMLYDLEGCGFNPDDFLTLFDLEDCTGDGDRDSFLTLPGNSAFGSGGSGEESMLCDLEGCGCNPDDFLSLFDLEDCMGDGDRDSFSTLPGNSATGVGSLGGESMLCDLEGCGFNLDDFLSLLDLEDCIGDRDSFLTLLENSAIGSGGSGEESMPCNLEGCGFDPDDFLTLEDMDVPL